VNAPPTSSIGRLFDAVASLCGIRDEVNYEGQAAAELEQRAAPDEAGGYSFAYAGEAPMIIDAAPVIAAVVSDLRRGAPAPTVAARFHNSVAQMITEVACRLRDAHALDVVALGGGVFQNVTLLTKVVPALEAAAFRVLLPRHVPVNDGGLALGQALVALSRLAKG